MAFGEQYKDPRERVVDSNSFGQYQPARYGDSCAYNPFESPLRTVNEYLKNKVGDFDPRYREPVSLNLDQVFGHSGSLDKQDIVQLLPHLSKFLAGYLPFQGAGLVKEHVNVTPNLWSDGPFATKGLLGEYSPGWGGMSVTYPRRGVGIAETLLHENQHRQSSNRWPRGGPGKYLEERNSRNISRNFLDMLRQEAESPDAVPSSMDQFRHSMRELGGIFEPNTSSDWSDYGTDIKGEESRLRRTFKQFTGQEP